MCRYQDAELVTGLTNTIAFDASTNAAAWAWGSSSKEREDNEMDVGTSAAVIAGITTLGKPAAELVRDFVDRVFGPTADAVGTALAHPLVEFNRRRARRSEEVLLRSAEILEERGIKPKAVPDYLLLPLLTHASLVDQEELKAVWARLLASAASGATDSEVRPSFPTILSELTANEARFLKYIYDRGDTERSWRFTVDDIIQGYDERWHSADFYLMLDNLARLRVVEMHPQISGRAISEAMGTLQRGYDVSEAGIDVEPGTDDRVFLTNLGELFMKACAGPKAHEVTIKSE